MSVSSHPVAELADILRQGEIMSLGAMFLKNILQGYNMKHLDHISQHDLYIAVAIEIQCDHVSRSPVWLISHTGSYFCIFLGSCFVVLSNRAVSDDWMPQRQDFVGRKEVRQGRASWRRSRCFTERRKGTSWGGPGWIPLASRSQQWNKHFCPNAGSTPGVATQRVSMLSGTLSQYVHRYLGCLLPIRYLVLGSVLCLSTEVEIGFHGFVVATQPLILWKSSWGSSYRRQCLLV